MIGSYLAEERLPRLPEKGGSGDFFPSQEETEELIINLVTYLQKWGVLVSVIIVLAILLLSLVAGFRKNPKLLRMFKYFGYGCTIMGTFFAYLPYYVLSQIDPKNQSLPAMPNDENSRSMFSVLLSYLKDWEMLICLYVIMIAMLYAYTAKIRNNNSLKRKYSFYAYGAFVLGITFYFAPGFILNYLGGS